MKRSESNRVSTPDNARGFDTQPMEALTDLDYGRYLVITASASTYVLEIGPESSSLVRFSGEVKTKEWERAPMRMDNEIVPLLGIVHLQLGTRAIFHIDVRGDGVETVRTTTPVSTIRRLA